MVKSYNVDFFIWNKIAVHNNSVNNKCSYSVHIKNNNLLTRSLIQTNIYSRRKLSKRACKSASASFVGVAGKIKSQ